MTKSYVTMVDNFMSGWGKASSKINRLVLECDTGEEAKIVYDNACNRGDMNQVQMLENKPSYDMEKVYVSWKTKEDYPKWYEEGAF